MTYELCEFMALLSLAFLIISAGLVFPTPRRRRARAAELELAVGMHPASRTTLPALREPTRAELNELARLDWDELWGVIGDFGEAR